MKHFISLLLIIIPFTSDSQPLYKIEDKDIVDIERCIKQYEVYLDSLGMSTLDKVYSIKIDEKRLKKIISISFVFSKSSLAKNLEQSKFAFNHNGNYCLLFGDYIDDCEDKRVILIDENKKVLNYMNSRVWNDVDGKIRKIKWIECRPALVYFPNYFRSIYYMFSSDMPECRSPIILKTEREFYKDSLEWHKKFKEKMKK